MNRFCKSFKSILFVITALVTGLVIFTAVFSITAEKTLLNPDLYKKLYVKHDMYSQIHSTINSTIQGLTSTMQKDSPAEFELSKGIFSSFEKSITQEIVKLNLDSLTVGIFQYLKGEKKFLPDIYLNTPQNNLISDAQTPSPLSALGKIDKISLSAILLYSNRNDINDYILVVKFLYYIIFSIPPFSMLFVLLFTVIAAACLRNMGRTIKWVGTAALTGALTCMSVGIAIQLYEKFKLPVTSSFAANLINFPGHTINAFLGDFLNELRILFIASGVIILAVSTVLFLSSRLIKLKALSNVIETTDKSSRKIKIIKASAIGIVFLCIVFVLFYKISIFKHDFDANDFYTAVFKLNNPNTVTQIIAASDETIYNLHIKLIDTKDSKPLPNIKITTTGKSSLLKEEFDETAPTNEEGLSKFKLDKGTFRIGILPENFPDQYQLPAPFNFELKSAGTTIITVNVDPAPEIEKAKPGIIEVEVLDKDNQPLQNIQVTAVSMEGSKINPDFNYSYTNSEGISVFKVNEGSYSIIFSESSLSEGYEIPSPFKADATSQKTSRYSIRLTQKKEIKATPIPTATPKVRKR